MKPIRAMILGASGYGGGELLRLLVSHPNVEAIKGTSRQHAGKPFSSVHPNLNGLIDGSFDADPNWAWLADCESPVLFAAMPHGEFAAQYENLLSDWEFVGLADKLTVIDFSADFRVPDVTLYEHYYKKPHSCPDHLNEFVYGLTEFNRDVLSRAKRIANPGCFATACQIALFPIHFASSLPGLENDDNGHVSIFGVTGSSGSGMIPSETTHHPTRAHDFRAYKALEHQHGAEIDHYFRDRKFSYSFVPHSAPIVRGIFVSAHCPFPGDETEALGLVGALAESGPFFRIVEGSPRLAAVVGTNFVDIGVAADGASMVVMVAIDNLMKGMAGQAVQNMNVALGLDETAGLWFASAYPG